MFDYNPETGNIRAYGLVGEYEDAWSATDIMKALDEMGGRDVTLQLHSEGGNIADGLSIYNQLSSYSGQVTVKIDAMAASIASVIAMAGDVITAFENATLMVHRAWAVAMGNAATFRSTADVLEKLDADIASVYAARTGKSVELWLDYMERETFFSAAEAKDAGLCDGIIENRCKPKKNLNEQPIALAGDAFPRRGALKAKLQAQKLKLRKHGF